VTADNGATWTIGVQKDGSAAVGTWVAASAYQLGGLPRDLTFDFLTGRAGMALHYSLTVNNAIVDLRFIGAKTSGPIRVANQTVVLTAVCLNDGEWYVTAE
jgi:hypothetical protein